MICADERARHRFLSCDDFKDPHKACEVCVKTHLSSIINDKQLPWMTCLMNGCNAYYSKADWQRILDPKLLMQRSRLEDSAHLASIKDIVDCLYCHFKAEPDPRNNIFECQNPTCMKRHCWKCKSLPHNGKSCEEAKKRNVKDKDQLRRLVEEAMSEALIRRCG